MFSLIISKINETYISISGEAHIIQELDDSFSFFADGYKYHPKYKSKIWDGKIRLIRRKSQNIAHVYYGLLDSIITFCKSHDYQYELNSNLISDNNVSNDDLIKYIHSLKVSSKGTIINPRDYQIKGFIDSIVNKRQLIISATSSGKSLIIYLICRYLESMNLKGLLIVPNISLIHQIYNDFDDYSSLNDWHVEDHVHKIFSGQEKITDKNLVLSTWQSLMNINSKSRDNSRDNFRDYFSQFDFTIVDECHGIRGKELSAILEKCTNASYRIGLTGTVGNNKANINTIIGLTGSMNKLNSTKELMEKKQVADFNIKCLILKYDEETRNTLKKYKYPDEVKWIVMNQKRNIFIKNLAISMKNNSLLLFNFIEHGKLLFNLIKESKHLEGRNVYLIYGGVAGDERERIRNIMETEKNAIILASAPTTSTGISIKNLHNIIFCNGTKSSIRVLQSIGRAIRLHDSKEKATIIDIVDDLSYKTHKNFSLIHFLERIKIYNEQEFDYKLINIPFESK